MIEVTNLSKRFGTTYAVNTINMQVGAGDIYGFIGHNGAGKSTTFRILATILRPDNGTATIDGVPITDGDKIRSLIGYMPDMFGVYDDMTVMQYLDFFGAAYFLPRQERRFTNRQDYDRRAEFNTLGDSRYIGQQRKRFVQVLVAGPNNLIGYAQMSQPQRLSALGKFANGTEIISHFPDG